jgi:galactokinase
MTGGGFGGSAIVLAPADRTEPIAEAIASAYDERGWDAPAFLTAPPSAGARRLR